MNSDFLLANDCAKQLYFDVAKDLPLIDYHNHLNYMDIAAGKKYENMTEAWVRCDGYKHRAMRICGADETYITGNASDKEKFITWCETVPKLYGGPLYDWSRIELSEIFGITCEINRSNAEKIWEQANEKLSDNSFSARGLYNHFNIKYSAPCTEIMADLSAFGKVDSMVPSLRADNLLLPSNELLHQLGENSGIKITDIDSYMEGISKRLNAFEEAGCCFSDHSLDNGFRYTEDEKLAEEAFQKILLSDELSEAEQRALASLMLVKLSNEYARRGWALQLHIGAQRATSTRLKNLPGACGGFAAIGNSFDVNSLIHMLDDIEKGAYGLPHKVIIYTLNPVDNAANAILSGSFVGVTQGPAWWWCDHLQGMRDMLTHFANFSVLSTFVGMNTDSRSLLSLSRHDYFRRTFCGWIGQKVTDGELPYDMDVLKYVTEAVCFKNADRLFNK